MSLLAKVGILSAELLMEIEVSSVGVLVSGPREMRQEVGKICASGFANNLHFESMSFSW